MSWTVKRIQEDDYGCRERLENEKTKVLVTLMDRNGQGDVLKSRGDWLSEQGIDEGDPWPQPGQLIKEVLSF